MWVYILMILSSGDIPQKNTSFVQSIGCWITYLEGPIHHGPPYTWSYYVKLMMLKHMAICSVRITPERPQILERKWNLLTTARKITKGYSWQFCCIQFRSSWFSRLMKVFRVLYLTILYCKQTRHSVKRGKNRCFQTQNKRSPHSSCETSWR